MKKISLILSLIFITAILMCGCGNKNDDMTSPKLIIGDDLSIDAEMVDDFDESVYDSAELASMMDKEAAEYNSTYGEGLVTAGTVNVLENRVKATMSYANADTYSQFNSRVCKVMSLEEALNSGSLTIALKSVKDNEITDVSTAKNRDKLFVLVTDEIGIVECPGKVMFISDGVETITKTSVNVTEGMDGLAYIIFINK